MLKRMLPLLFVIGLLGACAPTNSETTLANYTVSTQSPAITADDNSGLVYFFRPKSSGAFGVWYTVKEGNNEIAVMKNNTYLIHKTSLGKHTYHAKNEFSSSVDINVTPNSVTFIECNIKPGFIVANPSLKIVDKDRFDEKAKQMEYVVRTPKQQ